MGVCYDGMLSEEYKTAPVKIVWVLKEALYEGYLGEQLDNAINKKQANPTWRTMAHPTYAVMKGWKNGDFIEWECVPGIKQDVLKALRQIAVVNAKKEACTAKDGLSDNGEIISEYLANRDAIKKQIDELDADIIVFGYPQVMECIVKDVFNKMTDGKDYRIDKHFGDFASAIAEVKGKRRLFLWGYHPGYYRSEEKGEYSQYNYFTAFVDAVREFRGMK